ncbi:hypothetical protein PENTCL1PPCAC_14585, partial [Pristionchus entomophagus]
SPGSHAKSIIGGIVLVVIGGAIGYLVSGVWSTVLGNVAGICNVPSCRVTDVVDVEDIGERKSYCRCWKSETWPYCDGAHSKHNRETGDNLGPIVIKKMK